LGIDHSRADVPPSDSGVAANRAQLLVRAAAAEPSERSSPRSGRPVKRNPL
jgi:hypothetical protein